MTCKHFGECGSCSLYKLNYDEQINSKAIRVKKLLEPFYTNDLSVFSSPLSHYRARAEFRIWHNGDKCDYAMSNITKNGVVMINECSKVILPIENRMWEMLKLINASKLLSHRLFGVEFLASSLDEVLVTLLYHKKLDDDWIKEAKGLEAKLDISVIGRSRGQKLVLSKESVNERLNIDGKDFWYTHYEGGFTQPNPTVNAQMISWAKSKASSIGHGDLLESYCGLGNFTLPLSDCFGKVLATEVSKRSIYNALENCKINDIDNIDFIRLSSEEMSEALRGAREFNRLKGVDLNSYNFSCVLVDPPRAGLDSDTIKLISNTEHIIYISCNPDTLARDLTVLSQTHEVVDAAIFDQFPHTEHIESGVFLKKR
ncbi:MAG: tRNA (uridine(54)-C5)-methyltransferase TrmA [Sulfurovaceae bacterium]|nr:tRNA (uridine(54)-C5)-methyltransferase TrmA [Sulfurovaceae bacterium]